MPKYKVWVECCVNEQTEIELADAVIKGLDAPAIQDLLEQTIDNGDYEIIPGLTQYEPHTLVEWYEVLDDK